MWWVNRHLISSRKVPLEIIFVICLLYLDVQALGQLADEPTGGESGCRVPQGISHQLVRSTGGQSSVMKGTGRSKTTWVERLWVQISAPAKSLQRHFWSKLKQTVFSNLAKNVRNWKKCKSSDFRSTLASFNPLKNDNRRFGKKDLNKFFAWPFSTGPLEPGTAARPSTSLGPEKVDMISSAGQLESV